MMLNTVAAEEKPARKTRVKRMAAIADWCTGCGGVPVCRVYCKFDALHLVEDTENYPFRRMTVDGGRCVGCGACVASGTQGIVLTGCPWNAIRLMPVS
jgi:ferredoxin